MQYGEAQYGRAVYSGVSMICLLCLATMMGYRAKQLKFTSLASMNLIRRLVVALYLLGIMFVISAGVVENGLGLSTPSICHTAIVICLIFYVGSKVVMYFFLIERAHALRRPYVRRFSNWVWVVSAVTVIIGFGTIAVFAFLYPLSELSNVDGRCRIGLPLKITVPLLVFDVIINVALTAVFIHMLIPLLAVGAEQQGTVMARPKWTTRITVTFCTIFRIEQPPENSHVHPTNRTFLKGIESLLWRSLIGVILVLVPTVVNLGLLYHMKGRELGWLCFTICSLDVTWAVCIVHWLTVEPIDFTDRLPQMLNGDASSAVGSMSANGSGVRVSSIQAA